MELDEDEPLTISKWPFYLGDVVLVGAAIAIGVLSDWQLSNWQVGSCVAAVGLGAAFFVLPHIIEFYMRGTEASEGREAEINLLNRKMKEAAVAFRGLDDRLGLAEARTPVAGEDAADAPDRRYDLISAAMDQKLEFADQKVSALERQVSSLEQQVATAAAATATAESGVTPDSSAVSELESALGTLKGALGALSGQTAQQSEELGALKVTLDKAAAPDEAVEQRLKTLETAGSDAGFESRLAALEAAQVEVAAASPEVAVERAGAEEAPADVEVAVVKKAPVDAEVPEAKTEVAEARAVRGPRQRLKPEGGLLSRAIQFKSDSRVSAVDRIIDAKVLGGSGVREVSEVDEIPEVSEVASTEPELVVELDPTEVEVPVVDMLGMDEFPEEIEVSLGADLIEDDELLEAAVIAVGNEPSSGLPEVAGPRVSSEEASVNGLECPSSEEAVAPEPAVVEPEVSRSQVPSAADVLGISASIEETPAPVPFPEPVYVTHEKPRESRVTVSILIGIGNKPYIRGNAAGLSLETGVVMEFVEIGKWRWLAPADLAGPVDVQVYRNDEDPDRQGAQTLKPGETLEVVPVF